MKTIKRTTMALAISTAALIAGTAHADMVGGVGYGSLSDDGIRLGVVQGTLGYKIDSGNNFYLIPELRAGVGVSDDSLLGAKVEVDSFYGVNLRGQWEGENAYFFVAPSYTKFKVGASLAGVTASANDWEFGAGLGAGWRFSENTSLEATYEYIDGTDVVGVGLRFDF